MPIDAYYGNATEERVSHPFRPSVCDLPFESAADHRLEEPKSLAVRPTGTNLIGLFFSTE